MGFSATDAAFEGFRVVRRRPLALVFWALFYIVVTAVGFAIVGRWVIDLMVMSQALQENAQPTFADFQPLMASYGAVMGLAIPLSLVASAVLSAGVARSVLEPSRSAWGYLRFGMDEVRVLVVTLGLSLLCGLGAGVLVFVAAFITGLAAAAQPLLGALFGVILFFGVAAAITFVLVRLSLAVPITVAEKRMAFFESWPMTKAPFWPLLGMALIAVLMTLVVSLLGSLVFMPLQLGIGGLETLATFEGQGMMEMLRTAWPVIALWIVMQSILSALQLAVIYAPFSAAYLALKGN